MSGLIGFQPTSEIGFDFLLCRAPILIAELDTDTRSPITFGARRSDPNHLSRYRDALHFIHLGKQHEHIVTQLVLLDRRNK